MGTLSDYVFLKKIGQGSYGEVYLGRPKGSAEPIAIKCIPKVKLTKRGQDNLVTEISILQKLTHPHIVRLLDFSWDSVRVYLLMEYCAGGDLSRLIRVKRRLSEVVVRRFLRQLALALQYLHQKNITHMDLKPQNILLTSPSHPVLKVTDFGFAQHLQNTAQMSELRGTLLYMAPEIFCEGVYHPSCDLWSVGIIMYECLFGAPPYASSNLETLKMRLLNREAVQIPHNPQTSGNCSSLLKGLLRPDPSDRLNHQEFFDHPFVDLKHAPTAESLSHALSYLELAHECEQAGQLSAAYEKYTRGLAHLVSAIEYEPSPKQREELKQMASRYFDQAERVKSLLRSKSNTKFPPARPTCPPRRRVQAPCESADPHLHSKLVQQSSMATGPPHSTTCDTTSDEPKTATALPPSTWLSYVTSFLRRNPRTNSCTPVSAHSHPSPEVFPSAENPKVSLPSQSTQPLDQAIEESDDGTRCTESTLPINSASILKDLRTTLCDGSRNSLDTVSSNEQISRLRALSVSFSSPDSQSECRPSSTEFDLTYLQHMAILTDTERLLELKSLCSSPDNRYGSILDSVEEFYLLLRTNRLHAAISHVEANFPNWLAVAKDDINEERRRAIMKELKLVLDLIEWSKQQSSEQLSSSENAGATEADCPVSHEVGIDALSEADSTDTSCCIS